MHLKQFWQSLALNFTSASPNFAPIPPVMVTASEAGDDCHSYKTQKSSYAHFKNEYGSSLENTDCCGGFLTLVFWSMLQPFCQQSREDRKYHVRTKTGLFPHFSPAITWSMWSMRQIFFINYDILFEVVEAIERILYFILWTPFGRLSFLQVEKSAFVVFLLSVCFFFSSASP